MASLAGHGRFGATDRTRAAVSAPARIDVRMRSFFTITVAIAIVIATWSMKTAIAQDATPSIPPLCTSGVSAAAGPSIATQGAVTQSVTLSRPTGAPCVIAGYPELAAASPASERPLPVGRLSLDSSTTLEVQSPAIFMLRFVRAGGSPGAGCALSILVNGAKTNGAPLGIAPCTALSEIDVSSYASVGANAVLSPSPQQSHGTTRTIPAIPCGVADLRVREVASEAGSGGTRTVVAVQNRSLAACVLQNDVRAQLFDAQGQFVQLRIAPVRYGAGIPREIVLEPGHEASLALTYATAGPGGKACPVSQSIALALGTRGFTASAPAALAPCPAPDGVGLHETPLRPGVPLPGFE